MKEFDVVTVGDINPDIIFTGVKRTPGMGKEVFARSVYISIGGGAANTAIGLARLGLKVALVSTIGKDMFGLNFLKLLEKEGVSKRYIKVQEKVNTGITVAITDENDRGFITYRGANELQRLEDINDELIKQTRHLHITNYSPDQKQRFMEISQIAKKYNVTISMDVGWDEAEKWDKGIMEALKKVDIFMPNEYEARGYSGKDDIYEALY
ncbi:MAG: hypothetical protein PWP56_2741, partial [Acetobacterium sp.]|nr:hypothetical protein [Acetobacterium sp.]